uniref:XK-related protein n=1 Tax=Clytia hemisphaerica TaxID=252671 RepID=A0A7M5UXZ5_9CNID
SSTYKMGIQWHWLSESIGSTQSPRSLRLKNIVNDSALATQRMMKRVSDKLVNVENAPKHFTTGKAGIALTVFSIVLNLLNMYTDYAVAYYYFENNDVFFGGWTLTPVLLTSFFISLYTFILHNKSNGKFLMKIHFSKPLVYSLCLILHGHVARCLMWLTVLVERIPLLGVRKALWAFRDITSYAETFTHALPQLFLQMYIIVLYNGDFNAIQLICFVSSWLSAAWGIQSQFDGIKWKLLTFEMNLFWFASRAAATTMLASIHKSAPFIMILGHFLLMFPLWFWQNNFKPFRKKRGSNRFELIITDAFYAGIYAGSNTATPTTCKYQFWLAVVLFFENILCVILGMRFGTVQRPLEHFINNQMEYKHHRLNYGDLLNRTAGYCVDTPHWKYKVHCTVPYNTWIKSRITSWLAVGVTVFAFIQLVIIVILRQRKIIAEDAMVSKLGAAKQLSKAEGRVTATCSEATEYNTRMTPEPSPYMNRASPCVDKEFHQPSLLAISTDQSSLSRAKNQTLDSPKPFVHPRLSDKHSSSTNNIFSQNNTRNRSEPGASSPSLSVTVKDINIESVSVTQTPTCSQADIRLHMDITVSRKNSQN